MRIVFLGTPDFAVPSLEMLIEEGYTVAGVFTQPDRKKDRGQKMTMPPVKVTAIRHNIPVFQFEKIKSPEAVSALRSVKPDLMITAAFGQILSKEVLDVPSLGCVNVHASLLPKYRGAAPIEWAIMRGETVTGITTMYTDVGLDTGDMILKERLEIGGEETGAELAERLSRLGAKVLKDTLMLIEAGKAPREKQDEASSSYYPMLKKETGLIGWDRDTESIRNLCRALDGGMGAYTLLNGEKLKIYRISAAADGTPAVPGEVLRSSAKEGLVVKTGDGAAEVLELQLPGGRRLAAKEYLRGRGIPAGTVLGG
jgi:methionyl-tRNA formyltransferase